MKLRDAVIEYQKTLDDSGTLIKDLDIVDPISAIYLEHQATNGTTSNIDNWISDIITKIEIVDGSEVLYSVSLIELEALHFYKTKQTWCLFPSEWASGQQRNGCMLFFGRYLGDPEYAFDCRRYRNPQLKITSNLAAIRAVSATTAFATGTGRSTIIAKVMEGHSPPGKFLSAKELVSFSSSSSSGAEERKELPTDKPYRMLMTRHWLDEYDIDEVTSDLKLTADTDKYIAFNRKVKQLDAEALAQFGLVNYKHDRFQGYATAWRVIPNKEPFMVPFVRDLATPRAWVIYGQWSSNIYTQQYDLATPSLDSSARRVTSWIHGHAPHATLPIVFGDLMRPESWLEPAEFGKLELVFTSGGNSGTCAIVGEQVRTE